MEDKPTMDAVSLLLPVIWAVAATVIGLALYKSSSALVSQSNDRKTFRFTGSSAIAALAFFGMMKATPSARLEGSREGFVEVPWDKLTQLRNIAGEVDRKALEIQACAATLPVTACRDKIQDLKSSTAVMVDFANNSIPGQAQ